MTDDERDMRVLLSLTNDDVNDLAKILNEFVMYINSTPMTTVGPSLRTWRDRMNRISEHLVDSVDIHFTDLGT